MTRDDALTDTTQVTFSWTAPEDGGTPIIGYIVELDQGDNDFTQVGIVTDTSFTDHNVTAGTTYEFRVKAQNLVGFSTYSSTFEIVAATVPDAPSGLVRDES